MVDRYNSHTKTVYEFHGCFWHRCRTCHPQRTDVHPTLLDRTMDNVQDLVDKKQTLLQSLGYQVVEMWECLWNALKNTHRDLAEYLTHLNLQAPPREAFYGGRTYISTTEMKRTEKRFGTRPRSGNSPALNPLSQFITNCKPTMSFLHPISTSSWPLSRPVTPDTDSIKL